jgi:hypothetical protein
MDHTREVYLWIIPVECIYGFLMILRIKNNYFTKDHLVFTMEMQCFL